MEHPNWRRYYSSFSASELRKSNRISAERLPFDGPFVNEKLRLRRLPSYSKLLRRIGPAAARGLTDCEGAALPGSLLPGTRKAEDVKSHQVFDVEFEREMRLAREALWRREVLGVKLWLQRQRQTSLASGAPYK